MRINIVVLGRSHAFNLAQELKKNGILNKLITSYPSSETVKWGFKEDEVDNNILLEFINRYRKKIPFFNHQILNFYTKKLISQRGVKFLNNADIVIGWAGSSLEMFSKAKEKKIITVLDKGSTHYSYKMKILKNAYNAAGVNFEIDHFQWKRELAEYKLADYIAVPSQYVKKTFTDNGIEEKKLLVNPYGVDISQFEKIKKNDKKFRIIFSGTASIRKGFHFLLQAFSELNLPNSELYHMGNVSSEVKSFITKYKSSNIKFVGHKPQNELSKHYSKGSILVLPSVEEGLAKVQLKAMACELPIICSTNTGGNDIISKDGEEGFVIPVADNEALKEKIKYLYNNHKLCREIGQRAKKKVASRFTWEEYGKRYLKNLEQIYNIN